MTDSNERFAAAQDSELESSSRVSPAWGLIALFAAAKMAIHIATLEGYGYFRDELYYLSCTDHLAWGYVDQPPFSVGVLALVTAIFGEGQWTLRLVSATLGAGLVGLVGWMAARLGGDPLAQALAMAATLVAPMYLALHHFYSMNAWSLLFWAAASALLLELLDSRRDGSGPAGKYWLWLGVILGLGLLNKVDVLWLGAGLGLGLLIAGRDRLRSRGPWMAGTLAFLIFSPHLIWQALHGWPTLEFIRNASANKMKVTAPLDYMLEQVMAMHPLSLPIWLTGLVFLLVLPAGRRFRVVGWIYPSVLLILLLNSTSRSGYLAGAYPLLLAAGGVGLVSLFGRSKKIRWGVLGTYGFILLGTGAYLAPLTLPLLDVESYLEHAEKLGIEASTAEKKEVGPLPQFYADMFGWPDMAASVAAVYNELGEDERNGAAIFVGNYGEAGAMRLFGREHGLPPVLSGHNSHWMWGPGIMEENGLTGEVMIILGGDPEDHRRTFAEVELAGRTSCTYCMPYERDLAIFIARQPLVDLREAWPRIKHYD